jgi:hypothetical protein
MAEIYFTRTGQTGTPGIQGPAGADAVLPQNLSTSDSPSFDKIYITHNSDGTNVKVGDDAWIGDVDIANMISIKGVEDATKGGIVLGSNKTESISSDSHNITIDADNDIILTPGSTYAYIGTPELDGGNRLATWDYVTSKQFGGSASYFSTVDQTGTANSIQAMTLNATDWQTGISLESGSHIKFTNAGKYNIAFSAQLHQTSSSGIVNIWLAKNGTAVENSNTKVAIAANNPYNVAAWNFFVNASANDYYQVMWSSDSANTIIEYEAATGSGATLHPAVPSVILTVNQIG